MAPARLDVAPHPHPSARDLAAAEIWERSLERSRQRRRLTELARRTRRRRKSVSVAVSAALAAAPVLPRGIAAADASGSGSTAAGSTDTGSGSQLRHSSERIVVRTGSEGMLVSAAQRRLNHVLPHGHLAVDGIFGPLTRAAVLDFQRRQGIAPTGWLDVQGWAILFRAPVMVLSDSDAGADQQPVLDSPVADGVSQGIEAVGSESGQPATLQHPDLPSLSHSVPAPTGPARGNPGSHAAPTPAAAPVSHPVAVVAPRAPAAGPSTYVLVGGVALPLPRGYLVNGSVDQGVDYSAPGGTPEYAMGDGVIIGEGISGFGPNTPILQITSGPLKGLEVYYGHAGPDLVHVGEHVHAGQQITEVGYGIVGISTGPHLEVGVYPPGGMGAGSRMLSIINGLLAQHSSGRAWGHSASAARDRPAARVTRSTAASAPRRRYSAPQRVSAAAPEPSATTARSAPAESTPSRPGLSRGALRKPAGARRQALVATGAYNRPRSAALTRVNGTAGSPAGSGAHAASAPAPAEQHHPVAQSKPAPAAEHPAAAAQHPVAAAQHPAAVAPHPADPTPTARDAQPTPTDTSSQPASGQDPAASGQGSAAVTPAQSSSSAATAGSGASAKSDSGSGRTKDGTDAGSLRSTSDSASGSASGQ